MLKCNKKGDKRDSLTEHFEAHRPDWGSNNYNLNYYREKISEAREMFKGKIQVKSGIELGQPYICSQVVETLLDSYSYDYVIGSVHKLNKEFDISKLNLGEIALEELAEKYLERLNLLTEWGNFDCLGHIDLIKRHGTEFYNQRISLCSYMDSLQYVLKKVIQKGKGIEINTSGLRQKPKETMPGIDVLKFYKKLGGEVLTIGSDAHKAEDVGRDIRIALEAAMEAGFSYITVFTNRKPLWKKIEL
ncbi:histidinol phosphate phosphatase HisJ family protein [Clostridiales bacterium oral taxon 876 str. F0540]|nr:histidinol phosphate phosphatase HisJ family protein [Clostridiales bacterium oral taxon 876 str. F0540]